MCFDIKKITCSTYGVNIRNVPVRLDLKNPIKRTEGRILLQNKERKSLSSLG